MTDISTTSIRQENTIKNNRYMKLRRVFIINGTLCNTQDKKFIQIDLNEIMTNK
jgi:hypothetical protein